VIKIEPTKYKKKDALNCEITETIAVRKNFTVDGIMAQKKEYEEKLLCINNAIGEMRKIGCDFSKHDGQPPATN